MSKQIKIGHYADMQVFHDEKIGLIESELVLDNIVSVFTEQKIDGCVNSGDIFEFKNPESSVIEMVNRHIIKVLKIPTLQFYAVILGNHDYIDPNKNKAIYTEANHINTLFKTIKETNPELFKKFIYLKKQVPYSVTVNENNEIVFYPYSLEDGSSMGENILNHAKDLDESKLNISVHHDIVREYVEISKLPTTRKNLASVNSDTFFTNEIFGGDIHEHIDISGNIDYPNRKYFYPGNTYERNFGEGSYATIRKNVSFKQSPLRCVNIHTYDGNLHTGKSAINLNKHIGFLTIDINTVKAIDNVGEFIKSALEQYIPGTHKNFIRFKCSQMYASVENKLREFTENFFSPMTPYIEFIYDKKSIDINDTAIDEMKMVSLTNDFENGKLTETEFQALKMLIVDRLDIETISSELDINFDECSEMFNQHMKENLSIVDGMTSDNVDEALNNIILTKDKLHILFDSQLKLMRPNVLKTVGIESIATNVIDEVSNRFKEELDMFFFDRNQYNINLMSITGNSFCILGEFDIYLDNIGLTKIIGSNGVGKTTMFNMIYYSIKGKLFKYLKDNTVVKNTLLIFNIHRPDIDFIDNKLNMLVNGRKVTIHRTAERVWKSKAITNPKLKAKPDWTNYVQTVKRTVEVTVDSNGTTSVYNGDKAEQLLSRWFGDNVDDTFFVDKYTIPAMIKKPGSELTNNVMSHLAPYMRSLEDSLKTVKDAYAVKKPQNTMKAIHDSLNNSNISLNEAQEFLSTVDENIEQVQLAQKTLDTDMSNINNELINLGNIPSLINSKTNEISIQKSNIGIMEQEIQDFKPKESPVFDSIKPDDKQYLIDKQALRDTVDSYRDSLDKKKAYGVELENEYKAKVTDYIQKATIIMGHEEDLFLENLTTLRDKLINNKSIITNIVNNKQQVVNEAFSKVLHEIELKKQNIQNQVNNLVNDIRLNGIEITKLQTNIENSFCDACNRKFDDTDLNHIEKLKQQIQDLIDKNNSIGLEKNQLNNSLGDLTTIMIEFKTNKLNTTTPTDLQPFLNAYETALNDFNQVDAMVKSPQFESFNQIIEFLQNVQYVKDYDFDGLLVKWNEIIAIGLVQKDIQPTLQDIISKLKEINVYQHGFAMFCNVWRDKIQYIGGCDVFTDYFKLGNDEMALIIELANVDIPSNKDDIKQLETLLLESTDKYNALVVEYNNQSTIYNEAFNEYNLLVKEITDYNISIIDKNKHLTGERASLTNNEKELVRLTEQQPKYEQLVTKYDGLKVSMSELVQKNNTLVNQKINQNNNIKNIQTSIEALKLQEAEHVEYIKNTAIYSLYESMIKKHFKTNVFNYYREFLNSTLNLLLEDARFKLVWHEDGELYYTESSNGTLVHIPVVLLSGMQEIFCGLSLIFTISLLNSTSNIDTILIDELSGSLNDGKGLKNTEDIVDYQKQLVKLLFKFKNKKVFIVDHVIKDLFETEAYEVVLDTKTKQAKYITL